MFECRTANQLNTLHTGQSGTDRPIRQTSERHSTERGSLFAVVIVRPETVALPLISCQIVQVHRPPLKLPPKYRHTRRTIMRTGTECFQPLIHPNTKSRRPLKSLFKFHSANLSSISQGTRYAEESGNDLVSENHQSNYPSINGQNQINCKSER